MLEARRWRANSHQQLQAVRLSMCGRRLSGTDVALWLPLEALQSFGHQAVQVQKVVEGVSVLGSACRGGVCMFRSEACSCRACGCVVMRVL